MSKYRITLDGKTYEMEIELLSDNAAARPAVAKAAAEPKPLTNTAPVPAPVAQTSAQKPAEAAAGAVVAPMPGTVLRVEKGEGSAVKAGDLVLVLEAMKMENEILAPKDGTIAVMNCSAGATVAGGDVMFEIK